MGTQVLGRRLLAAALCFLLVGWASAVVEIQITQRAPYVAKEQQHGEATVYVPAIRFGCREPIYFAMDLTPYRGQTLALTWTDPAGKVREVNRRAVEQDDAQWLVALRLVRDSSPANFFSGPGSGYESLVGDWKVELASDRLLWTGYFEVLC